MAINENHFTKLLAASVRTDAGCLLWSGTIGTDGYARYSSHGAHRISYEYFVGAIPRGMTVDHLCFEPRCVEPAHLRLLTALQNKRNRAVAPCVVPDTHCVNGHRWTVENTYIRPNGNRDCRTCIRARVAAYKARKATAA